MKRYYISNITGNDGISRYASQFYKHILGPLGYKHVDSSMDPADILSRITSKDIVHVEAGIFSHREQEILERMLESGYTRVRLTMHDPPLFRYPSKKTGVLPLDYLVKYSDRFLGGQRVFSHMLQKVEVLYVLSERGQEAVRKSYGLHNVKTLPLIVPDPVQPRPRPACPDFMYMGFIGKNKGLEYALKVHALFREKHPESAFHIAGTALGKAAKYLNQLMQRNYENVHFLGYVPEPQLTELCYRSAFAFQPFRPYHGYVPASASILYCMEKGTLVLARPVNAIPELITDQQNGILLSGRPKQDARIIHELWSDPERYEAIRRTAYENLVQHYSPGAIAGKLID